MQIFTETLIAISLMLNLTLPDAFNTTAEFLRIVVTLKWLTAIRTVTNNHDIYLHSHDMNEMIPYQEQARKAITARK